MQYTVLANKWRPQIFKEVIGQEYIVQLLINSINLKKIHHAWLFTGIRGIGKTTLARILAKSLSCLKSITTLPCRICNNCISIEQGKFLDFIELDAASRTKIEDIKIVLESIHYTPIIGRFKIYLIDEIHMLSKHSFNALLKTLEEPPKHVKFILATTELEKLPYTIRSRCLQLHLQPIHEKKIYKFLKKILKKEKIDIESKAIELLSQNSSGSIRDAINMTELVIASEMHKKITYEKVTQILGICHSKHIIKFVKYILTKDLQKIFKLLDFLENLSISLEEILIKIIQLFHYIALLQVTLSNQSKSLKKSLYSIKKIYNFAKITSFEKIQKYYTILINGRKNLKYAPNIRIGLEILFLQIYHEI
ncbi:DNA polymerase III subunit gamma/tau [Buchnera aphidicola]|uniref:DNA polymerase III subunit gamma/tau n=1 Tax=Buchnera aphidicola subsp. Tuberolachnus salignus TaxID=98804 RepID=A0A160SXN4_BUCTT|nr:DNA polymerase III subunit gamma/tau [Buchnera aphidicola]CUR53285.1 DNA polymerase III subunit tau, isoform gamma [Buchnera aphidicola (Tuberolachnus salignus)]